MLLFSHQLVAVTKISKYKNFFVVCLQIFLCIRAAVIILTLANVSIKDKIRVIYKAGVSSIGMGYRDFQNIC